MSGKNQKPDDRASGAYIFRPNGTQPVPITPKTVSYSVFKGEHVTEVHQVFSDYISQVVRLYDISDSIEFEWLVGPIPIGDKIGKEIVTRYTTDIPTNGAFFTDANGRELLKRKRDFRPSWPYRVYEPVAGNYYPVNSRIIISDKEDLGQSGKTLIVLNDRAQGGTSMNDGEIELMVHRRLLHDDAFGVGEALNESAYGTGLVARGKHWIVIAGDQTGVPVSIHRPLAQEIFMDKVMAFTDSSKRFTGNLFRRKSIPLQTYHTRFSKLATILPPNIHLLTLEPLAPEKYLLRLEHIYENGEHPEYSKKVSIPVQSFKDILPEIMSIRETTLGANQWKSDMKRFDWIAEESQTDNIVDNEASVTPKAPRDRIELKPMQIKTFIISTVSNE